MLSMWLYRTNSLCMLIIGASEASPFLVMNVAILSVCVCVCVCVCVLSVCVCVCVCVCVLSVCVCVCVCVCVMDRHNIYFLYL